VLAELPCRPIHLPPLLNPARSKGDLDFSIPAYKDLTGIWPHRLSIEWEWADCGELIDGPIHVSARPCTFRVLCLVLHLSH
jgi:hypothetical protein